MLGMCQSDEIEFIIGNYRICLSCSQLKHDFQLGLSTRERQALKLFAQGYGSQDAATHMGVSRNTVDTFRRRILEKLGVNSTAQAIAIATAWWSNARMEQYDAAKAA